MDFLRDPVPMSLDQQPDWVVQAPDIVTRPEWPAQLEQAVLGAELCIGANLAALQREEDCFAGGANIDEQAYLAQRRQQAERDGKFVDEAMQNGLDEEQAIASLAERRRDAIARYLIRTIRRQEQDAAESGPGITPPSK